MIFIKVAENLEGAFVQIGEGTAERAGMAVKFRL